VVAFAVVAAVAELVPAVEAARAMAVIPVMPITQAHDAAAAANGRDLIENCNLRRCVNMPRTTRIDPLLLRSHSRPQSSVGQPRFDLVTYCH
jgi:hypothetical protein